ncbi:MAG: class D sortase [Ignavibacteriales bacterium]
MKKNISIFLITIGLIIALYPLYGRLFNMLEQKNLLQEWEKSTINDSSLIKTPDIKKAQTNFIDLDKTFKNNQQTKTQAENLGKNQPIKRLVLGILKIPKINLKYAVLDNVTNSSLSVGLGWIPGTSKIGAVGNAGIAGHRSHTNSKFFNRLDELSQGDLIYFEDKTKKYTFEVYEKLIVTPTDVSVLKGNDKDVMTTLVTCHPLYISSHRLIIHAKLKATEKVK